jgi:hypothetical protein
MMDTARLAAARRKNRNTQPWWNLVNTFLKTQVKD